MAPHLFLHRPGPRAFRTATATAAIGLSAGLAGPAQAQFSRAPQPVATIESPAPSAATDDTSYRRDAARHIYARFAQNIHAGKLPPMMYAVMITDTEIDARGEVREVTVVRPPAAAREVTPWVVDLIRRAAPFPAPTGMGGKPAIYREIWLVNKTGHFQVDTLTEGQL